MYMYVCYIIQNDVCGLFLYNISKMSKKMKLKILKFLYFFDEKNYFVLFCFVMKVMLMSDGGQVKTLLVKRK